MAKKYQSKIDYDKFKAVVIVLLVLIIGCMGFGLWWQNKQIKNSVSSDEKVYLEVFDDLAGNFTKNLDINADYREEVKMKDYGVSKTDGNFYIEFEYVLFDEDGNPVGDEAKTGKVYFWKDAERGNYSYAFSYDQE